MARRRRQELAQKRRSVRQKQLLIGGSIAVAIVAVALFLYYVVLVPKAELPDGVDTAYAEMSQSVTSEGYGVLGEATAPVEVREYSSFACPHCKDLQPQIKSLLPYIAEGQVRLVFIPIYNIAGEGAEEGAKAAICAGQQGKFFEMHDTMFYWQGRFGYGSRRIADAAEQLDLDVDQFSDCYGSGDTEDLSRRGRAEFDARGYTGTPVVLVNGNISGNVVGDVEALLGS